ncbi:Endoglucanase [Holothuria leucospilota]|uniref:Endoglucanase n=1 Tax=Holothuria leucospilota TaxID=206669 RepID=A0A9Q1CBG1_HOLLE|nr:Endoglucanase [Holothuria leucospilota]
MKTSAKLSGGFILVLSLCFTGASSLSTRVIQSWPGGFKGVVSIPISARIQGGWTMEITFRKRVTNFQVWRANAVTSDNKVYTLTNKPWNADLNDGSVLEIEFLGNTGGSRGATGRVTFNGEEIATPPPTVLDVETCSAFTTLEVVDGRPAYFRGRVSVKVTKSLNNGWTALLSFSRPVRNLQIWTATVLGIERNSKIYRLGNMQWNANLQEGDIYVTEFLGEAGGSVAPEFSFRLEDQLDECDCTEAYLGCSLAPEPTTDVPTTQKATTTLAVPTTTEVASSSTRASSTSPTTVYQVQTLPPDTVVDVENCTIHTRRETLEQWDGFFRGRVTTKVTNSLLNGWTALLSFSEPVTSLQLWRARLVAIDSSSQVYLIENESFNSQLMEGEEYEATFIAGIAPGSDAPEFSFRLADQLEECSCDLAATGCTVATSTLSPEEPKSTSMETSPSSRVTSTSSPQDPTSRTSVATEESSSVPTSAPVSSLEPGTATSMTRLPYTTALRKLTTDEPSIVSTTSMPVDAPYDYAEVLHLSILFYEAQRSGDLPPDNRIPYRGDSALGDQGLNGEDLTGGWYDAGDHVKFGFPMAWTATTLAWGLIEFKDAYQRANELENMYDSLKWATDYFLKCHAGKNKFYAQVGDGFVDHGNWGRPEEMTVSRPAFLLDQTKPGSDVVGETVAALAAASIAFKDKDANYADELLLNAKLLFPFAVAFQGKYSDSIPNAASFYRSSGYQDELAWASAWLYRATNDVSYLTFAEQTYSDNGMGGLPWAYSWDDKMAGVQMLLYQVTAKSTYSSAVERFIHSWLPNNQVAYTPGGLAWRDQWGPNRYAANTAFIATIAAKEGISLSTSFNLALSQINYMLGDNGRSFVVGFGNNPPDRPHHRSSSCPSSGPCDSNNLHASGPNPQVLYGALVGGPDQNDVFTNDRTDYITNEVACDYNAGFQSAVAGLLHFFIEAQSAARET